MVHQIVKEIGSIRKFYRSRSNEVSATLRKSFADGVVQMINSTLELGTLDATMITDAIYESDESPFGEHTERIITTLDARLDAAVTSGARRLSKNRETKQFLKCFWNICTEQDWDHLNNKKNSWLSKQTFLIERAYQNGLTNPNEESFRWMLAFLLVVHYNELPSARQLYDKLGDLKKAFKCEQKPLPHEHIPQLPESPNDLPQHIFKHAYPCSNRGPVAVAIAGINTIAASIPLRENSKLLKGKHSKELRDDFVSARESLPVANVKAEPAVIDAAVARERANSETTANAMEHVKMEHIRGGGVWNAITQNLFKALHDHIKPELGSNQCALEEQLPAAPKCALKEQLPEAPQKLSVSKDDTGRLVLRPRVLGGGSSTAPVDNPDQTAGATDELQKQQPPTPALDSYAAAAIAALQKRNATKAAQSKKTKEEKKQLKLLMPKKLTQKAPKAPNAPNAPRRTRVSGLPPLLKMFPSQKF